jgi:hypothetical protein
MTWPLCAPPAMQEAVRLTAEFQEAMVRLRLAGGQQTEAEVCAIAARSGVERPIQVTHRLTRRAIEVALTEGKR